MNYTVLLYYNYVTLPDPEAERVWQRQLCEQLDLKGRILLATEGINGTVAGSKSATDDYMAAMASHAQFATTEFKIDTYDKMPFPRLSIKVRPEIVTLGVNVDPAATAPKLTAEQFNELITDPNMVLFDARNNYESAIGKFKGALTPDISLFKDFPEALDDYEDLKDKTIITYCTGGIRCEKASALMLQRGFSKVYQLDGGIIKYAQKYPEGAFEGNCFVFDERMSVAFSDDPEVLSNCVFCEAPTSHYQNCANPRCHKLMLVCEDCTQTTKTCSQICANILV
ncbi:rhodanese-related sulfurtransferase [Candidatus Saccharibacteria bacterium]|nr:rhodanese-related sulfurtransferase [Candidatus Saccharibacteria bacterium]